jgi:ribosome maturation factor RimP
MDKTKGENIRMEAEKAAAEAGLYILHFAARGTDSRPVIEITLDGDRLVKVEDCASVSKQIQEFADRLLGEHVNYRLDVLSPGVDEPIVYDYQLKRSIGRTVKVHWSSDEKETDTTGILRSFTDSVLEIEQQKQVSRGQPPKTVGTVSIQRVSILSVRQIAVLR